MGADGDIEILCVNMLNNYGDYVKGCKCDLCRRRYPSSPAGPAESGDSAGRAEDLVVAESSDDSPILSPELKRWIDSSGGLLHLFEERYSSVYRRTFCGVDIIHHYSSTEDGGSELRERRFLAAHPGFDQYEYEIEELFTKCRINVWEVWT